MSDGAVATGAPAKRRIAVLGGGPSALAAVHELTLVPEWQSQYEITVYQLGWRLGGKCASGRGPHARVEEHGIHIFQGWYNNAFWLVKEVYAERNRLGIDPRSPFPNWYDAWERQNAMIMVEYLRASGAMHNWAMVFPPNQEIPGAEPPSTWVVLTNGVGVLVSVAVGTLLGSRDCIGKTLLLQFLGYLDDQMQQAEGSWCLRLVFRLLRELTSCCGDQTAIIVQLLTILRYGLDALAAMAGLIHWENGRCALALAELGVVALIGILEDVWNPQQHKFDYHNINNQDFRSWLRSHGASELACNAGMVRFIYDATFSELAGTCDDGGQFAAGEALRSMVQMLGYKGSMVWQPRAGVADVVIGPMYQVLRESGVKFKFFQQVVQVNASEKGEIESISMSEQVKLRDGVKEYEPFVPYQFGDSVLQTWPNRPKYELLNEEQAKLLQENHIDLECPWADWPLSPYTLEKGKDFDDVFLCIPVAALKDVCSDIIEKNPRWAGMVRNVKTTPTIAMQLWLSPTLLELGMNLRHWGLPRQNSAPNCEVCVDPFSSWTDCSVVLQWEQWPNNNLPRTLVYYCGAFDEEMPMPPYSDHDYPRRELERVQIIGTQWLNNNMGFFWPKGTCMRNPRGLHLDFLVSPLGPHVPEQIKYMSQYFRANVSPSERYTLCVPWVHQWRMTPHGSGYRNLYLAGDWVQHAGINAGFFEGAVIAGRQCAKVWLTQNLVLNRTVLPPIFVESDVIPPELGDTV